MSRGNLFMIKQSFIFLDKIGQRTEQQLWQQGINSWDIFLGKKTIAGIGNARKLFYNQKIHKAKQALQENNAFFFAQHFPQGEHWRLYDFFREEACFVDIETSGYYGDITVVGLYDGRETKTMVKGKNLDPVILGKLLRQYKLIVSFNGSGFDLPVLNRYYPNTVPSIPHLDLRHALAKLGFTGGLKNIEKQFGIKRAKEVEGVSGSDAVYLWQMYKATGKEEYLERLVQYNEEDVINLKPLAEFAYKELKKKSFLLTPFVKDF